MQMQCGEAAARGRWESDVRMSVVVSEVASVLDERDEKWGKAGDEHFLQCVRHSVYDRKALTTAVVAVLATS